MSRWSEISDQTISRPQGEGGRGGAKQKEEGGGGSKGKGGAKERPKVKAKAKVNSRKPTIKAKPEKEVSPGGLSEGSRARLGKLAAKKRGQAKDRNDFWKRVG